MYLKRTNHEVKDLFKQTRFKSLLFNSEVENWYMILFYLFSHWDNYQ